MTATHAPRPVRRRRWWLLAALVVICAVAALSTYLTAPRPGGQMDPESTGPAGAHALVTLLRDRGVTVVVAHSVDEAVNAAGQGSLLLFGQTQRVTTEALLNRLAGTPGDLLLLEPTSRARAALSPGIRNASSGSPTDRPNCELREANQAGSVDFGLSNAFQAAGGRTVSSCYGGALVRYRDGDRTVTVVGSTEFMTNGALLRAGNAALAMNLAGTHSRLVWFTPNHVEGGSSAKGKLVDLIPDSVLWMIMQLCVTVGLVALWKGRRIGPLVAETLPVVVRASETVEGRGRLYRSRRARDRAADALRNAALQRLRPRLGVGADASPAAVVQAIAARNRSGPEPLWHILFGPPPATDTDLVQLARALDDIERQVAHS
ncbi:DUF4350 domain-containing protein [Mycobacterium paraterrae]|uniref:DUF4350 domain-containing protein n=1 Tax=Mycobacterium paraterrae TaxID=577492 RepID=A0ABY3VS65_9MYCO|nr:DUF4350 domain-containing protein [Mycobacterium paraterrae]UMB70007.1 DUF4350 domain-containing protein [Mycobacterium paraterrae]